MSAPDVANLEARLPQELDHEVRIAMTQTNTERELARFQRTTLRELARRRVLTAVAAAVVLIGAATAVVTTIHGTSGTTVPRTAHIAPAPARTILRKTNGPTSPLPKSVTVTRLSGPQNLGVLAFGDLWATTGRNGIKVLPHATLYRISANGNHVLSTASYPKVNDNQPNPVQIGNTIVVADRHGGYTVFDQSGHKIGLLSSTSTLGAAGGDSTGGWVATAPDVISRVSADGQLTGQPITLPLKNISGIATSSAAIWVTDLTLDELIRVDPADGQVTGTTKLGFPATQVRVIGNAVYVTTSDDFGLHRVDPTTMQVTATAVGSAAQSAFPTFEASYNGEIWTQALGGTITQLDSRTLGTERTIRLFPELGYITNGAVIGAHRIYVVDGEANKLYSYPTR